MSSKTGSHLFIVDKSDEDWKVLSYAALEATQGLMRQIDEVIEAHGGWPTGDGRGGAFSLKHPPTDVVALAADAAARPKGRRKSISADQTGVMDIDLEAPKRRGKPRERGVTFTKENPLGRATRAGLGIEPGGIG